MGYNTTRKIDTLVAPSHDDGFQDVFLKKAMWYPLIISAKSISKISYLAIYRTLPISAVTHYAVVKEIVPCEKKYHTYYAILDKNSITTLSNPVKRTPNLPGPRGVIYTTLEKLQTAEYLSELTQ